MTILLVLIPLGLVLLGLAVWAFVWAVRHGQFEELESEGLRILLDDDRPAPAGPEARAGRRATAASEATSRAGAAAASEATSRAGAAAASEATSDEGPKR